MNAASLSNIFSLDFVSWWKAASILLTGFFGILGLVSEFKEPSTKKITKWGKLALVGILASTGFGVYSQMLEIAGQNEKRAEDARQALQISLSNQQTLNAIERSLSLLDEPAVWAVFSLSCERDVQQVKTSTADEQRALTEKMRRFCRAMEPFNKKLSGLDTWPEEVWKLWPWAVGRPGQPVSFNFSLLISRPQQAEALESQIDEGRALLSLFGTPDAADWFMDFVTQRPNSVRAVKLDRYTNIGGDNEKPRIAPLADMRPQTNVNNGNLKSMIDLDGAYLYIAVDGTSYFRPDFVSLKFRNGRNLSLNADDFELLGDKTQYYRAKIKIEH